MLRLHPKGVEEWKTKGMFEHSSPKKQNLQMQSFFRWTAFVKPTGRFSRRWICPEDDETLHSGSARQSSGWHHALLHETRWDGIQREGLWHVCAKHVFLKISHVFSEEAHVYDLFLFQAKDLSKINFDWCWLSHLDRKEHSRNWRTSVSE